MSAIAGIYHLDGPSVSEDLLLGMRDIVDYRGPDGSGIWTGGKVGFGHRLLWNSEESVHEKQPMTNGRGLWITADARIDNRDELKTQFRSRGIWNDIEKLFDPFPAPDAAYILFSYQLWGEEAPAHLLGDFSFAIWDDPNQKLFCARDPIGIKPFFYHWNGRKFLFGSQIKQIFQDASIASTLNVPHLADSLTLHFPNREETPYEACRKLPPAHFLRIGSGGLEIKRFWELNPDPKISENTLEKNAGICRSLLEEAVRVRLRTPPGYRAGSLLSGGLDSSSIVSVAATLQNRLSDAKSPFPVFTLYFPEANPLYRLKNADWVNEEEYVKAVLEKYPQLEYHPVEIKGWGPLENLEENLWCQDVPLLPPNIAYFQHLFKRGRGLKVRSLFHGEGGDELFVGRVPAVKNIYRELFFGFLGMPKRLLRAILPEGIKNYYRKIFRKMAPDYFDPRFAKRMGLEERLKTSSVSSRGGIYNWLCLEYITGYLEATERFSSLYSLEVRYPFLDLRLLKFSAAVPDSQKTQGRLHKIVLRESLKDLLPNRIRERLGKAEFSPAVRTYLEKYASKALKETFENSHPLLRSMTRPKKIKAIYKKWFYVQKSGASLKTALPLRQYWHLLSVDQWLKHRCDFEKNKRRRFDEKKGRVFFESKVGAK